MRSWFSLLFDFLLQAWNHAADRRDSLAVLQSEIQRLKEDAAREREKFEGLLRIQEEQVAALTDVIARDRERVKAEAAAFVASRETSLARSSQVASGG